VTWQEGLIIFGIVVVGSFVAAFFKTWLDQHMRW